MNKIKRSLLLLLISVLILGALVGCGGEAELKHITMEDVKHAKIGVVTGSSHDKTISELFPDAQKVFFGSVAEEILALEQGKIDCYIEDAHATIAAEWEGANIKRLRESLKQVQNGFAFREGDEKSRILREQMNEFIARARAEGTVDRLLAKWLDSTEPTEHPDYAALSGENGTIKLAAVVENKPMAYIHNGQYTGFEIELLTLFGQQYGYNFNIDTAPFTSVIAGISTGKYDIAASGMNITPEREESVDFSDPYASFDVVVVVREDKDGNKANKTLADFSDSKMGIITGSAHGETANKVFPDAEKMYFNAIPDMVLAVEQGKIDCYIEDAPFIIAAIWEGANVKCIQEPVAQMKNGFVFPQNDEGRVLRDEINTFLEKSKADGTVDRLLAKWMDDTEPTEHPDYRSLTGEKGTIKLAVCVDSKPLLYKIQSGCTGFEIELLTLFAEQNGYALDVEEIPFESIIAGIYSEKYDMAAAALNITPEREESVDFSDPYAAFDVVLVTKGDDGKSTDKTLKDFENATIGIHMGTIYDSYARETFPNAERRYYPLISDLILATEQEKIDGYITEIPYLVAAIWEGANVTAIDEVMAQTRAGYIFQKGERSAKLKAELNNFIIESRENGYIDELSKKWFSNTEPEESLDYDSLTGENGTLRIAVAPDLKPNSYIKDDSLTGYEMELLVMFAKEHGYKLDISYMTFDAILPGVVAGKYDIGTGATTITEERAQSVDFSESHLTVDVVMAVKDEQEDAVASVSFWDELKNDFEKTFIREDRWKLIVEGIGVTALISLSSAVAGTLLGFGLYMLTRSDIRLIRRISRGVARVYSRIVAGTPVVVILMILFYVVFGNIRDMSGVPVAVIGFTLTFGAFVYDHMHVAVDSVAIGQWEAAFALGYTKNKTFFRIVFPQAMTIFLPSYCGQAVELIKATAVVGYIAVNDLTKMGDIIRSNTYEAFFPLIATAVIYFLLTWLLSLLLGLVKLRFEPKRRSKEDILKGVKTV